MSRVLKQVSYTRGLLSVCPMLVVTPLIPLGLPRTFTAQPKPVLLCGSSVLSAFAEAVRSRHSSLHAADGESEAMLNDH